MKKIEYLRVWVFGYATLGLLVAGVSAALCGWPVTAIWTLCGAAWTATVFYVESWFGREMKDAEGNTLRLDVGEPLGKITGVENPKSEI